MILWRTRIHAWIAPIPVLAGALWTLALLVTTACAPAARPDSPSDDRMSPAGGIVIPRGLADPQGRFAYLRDLQDLIHRLDLETGVDLAQTAFPARPLVLSGDQLIAWAPAPDGPPALRFFALGPAGSALVPEWEAQLPLPDWVEVDSPEPGRFIIEAQSQADGLAITWWATASYAGGAPPSPEVAGAQDRSAGGTIHINLETGAIEGKGDPAPAPAPDPTLPALPAGRFIVPYRRSGDWATFPWPAGSGEAYLVREAASPGVLLVNRSGVGEELTRLSDDPLAEAAVTPDGELIFVYEPGSPEPAWQVFSAATGDPVSRLPYDLGTEDVSVLGEAVLYLVLEENGGSRGASLRCRELRSGQLKWAFSLGAEALRAPPPLRP